MPRLVTICTWLPAELLKSAVWLFTETLTSSMLSTGVGITPVAAPPVATGLGLARLGV